jgi:hypothetical protein
MKLTYERKLMLKSLEDNLSSGEEEQLQALFKESPSLKRDFEELRQTHVLVATAKEESFKPYFADRVLKRFNKEQLSIFTDESYNYLVHMFYRFAFTAFIVAMLLGSYNLFSTQDSTSAEQPFIESVIALPPLSINDASSNITLLNNEVINYDENAN